MNLKMLSDEELIRISSPETELEVVLFERLEDALRRAVWAEEELGSQSAEWDDHECDCSEQDERIEYLASILNKHKIEYK
jgi:hypothetical protein